MEIGVLNMDEPLNTFCQSVFNFSYNSYDLSVTFKHRLRRQAVIYFLNKLGSSISKISLFYVFPFFYFSGNTDIHNGNLKLILGLLWSLIAHYQLGASNFPPKKLMLAWLKVNVLFNEPTLNSLHY